VAPAVALQGFDGLQIPPRCAITFRALAGGAFDASGIELDRDLVGLMDDQAATPGMADFMKLADNSGAIQRVAEGPVEFRADILPDHPRGRDHHSQQDQCSSHHGCHEFQGLAHSPCARRF
jgi:hypothetical protein